jgi:DNA damage-binding protein 1
VVDLMKSLSLVEYTRGRAGAPDTLIEVARHFETLWSTAVAPVDAHSYLVSDAEGNLFVIESNPQGFSADDRRRLQSTSELLLGEMVNRIRPIAVTPSPHALVVPRAFLATVEGAIYLFALIAPDKQDLLMRMQAAMAELVRSPGHVPFAKWRGVKTQVRDMGERGPERFVDGELIERFLDCDVRVQEEIVGALGGEWSVEGVREMVESLKRIH